MTRAPPCGTRGAGTDLHHTLFAVKERCAHSTCTCGKDKLHSVAAVGVKSLVSWSASSSVLLEFEALKRPQNLCPSITVMVFCSLNVVVMFLLSAEDCGKINTSTSQEE